MHGDGSTSGGSLGIEEAELGVAFGQSVLVVEHGLDELINDILAQILGSNESSLNGDADDIAGHAGIGGGGQVVTDQERIGLLNGGELFVSEGDEVEGVGGGVVDDSGRGSTGDGEGGIDLAVLELVNAILEGAVHRIDVVLGQTRSAEHLPGVDLGTGTNVTNADGLALEVGNGVDAGLGKDLNGLVVDTGDPKSVGLGSAVEGVGALVRVVDNVGLQNGHLSLAVGFDAEFPPFGFIAADGTYDGFDLAMAKELCARLGWEYEAVAIDWNSKDAELSSGTNNCIWNGFTYTGRENDYTFSDPYVDNSIVMVVKADSGITSLADLAGKSVMAQAASSAVDAINENEDFKASLKEVVELGDYNMGFMDLAQGTVDAVAADLGVAQYQIANNDGDYVILDEPLSTEQYAIGFLKGNTELRDAVNAELLKMAEDGTMLEIAQKYVDQGLVLDSLCLINK